MQYSEGVAVACRSHTMDPGLTLAMTNLSRLNALLCRSMRRKETALNSRSDLRPFEWELQHYVATRG